MSDIVDSLRAASRYALMDAARALVLQAADEIERLRTTNHDAAPAARATVGRPRTDKADLPTRCGTGETLSEAEIDALEFVVEEGRIANIHDYGILRSLLIRLRQEWEFSDSPKPIKDAVSDRPEPIAPTMLVNGVDRTVSYAKSDEKRVFYDTKRDTTEPRNGALSGCETVPDPDSRVWETQRTPQPHATPPQGSVHDEDSVPRSRTENEPVAWAVVHANGFGGVVDCYTSQQWCKYHFPGPHFRYVPLYRHPSPPLGDPEIAVEMLKDRVAELETAIRRLADQDATLSLLCKRDGSQVVTVTMDGTLTDAEREAVEWAESHFLSDYEQLREPCDKERADTLRKLLERLG